MVLFEIAVYIFFVVFVMVVATQVLWLVFLLFNFRVWESILTYEFLSKHIEFAAMRDYYILIIIISVITYLIILFATMQIPILRYILLLLMVIYTIRNYEIADILFFKDLLVKAGMWDLGFWKQQFSELLKFSVDDFHKMFTGLWDKFWDGLTHFFGYLKTLLTSKSSQ